MEQVLAWLWPGVAAVLGGTGLVGWYKARQDAKKGIRETDIAEDVSISDQWRQLIEAQSKSLLEPLTSQVSSLRAEVVVLQDRVRTLEKERTDWVFRESLFWDWTEDLVRHIAKQLPPPAPKAPEGLNRRR